MFHSIASRLKLLLGGSSSSASRGTNFFNFRADEQKFASTTKTYAEFSCSQLYPIGTFVLISRPADTNYIIGTSPILPLS